MSKPSDFTDTSDEALAVQLDCLRRMTPQERLRRACAWSGQVRRMAFDAIRRRHPDYSEDEVRLKFIELTQLPQLRLKKARKSLFFNGRARKVGTTFGPFREEGGGVGGVPGRGDRAEWLGPDQDAQRTESSVSGRH